MKGFRLTSLGIMAMLLAAAVPMPVSYADTQNEISVLDFGADGTDNEDDYDAIEKALKRIGFSDEETVTVRIPAGKYYLSNHLHISSNTNLVLDDDAELIRTDDDVMMLISDVTRDGEGEYKDLQNVNVTGGIWNGNIQQVENGKGLQPKNLIYLWHGDNIHFSDMKMLGCCGNHYIELAAVSNASIKNVTFDNFYRYAGTSYHVIDGKSGSESSSTEASGVAEAIQLDYADYEVSRNASPYDNTPCKDIIISDCEFNGCPSGVGNHHKHPKMESSNITISNNTFKNVGAYCINLPYMTNVKVTGNKAEEIQTFLLATEKSDVTASNNKVIYSWGKTTSPRHIFHCLSSKMTLNNNTVNGSGKCFVCGTDSTINLKNNTFTPQASDGSQDNEVYFKGCKYSLVGNTLKNARKSAVSIEAGSTGTMSKNKINTTKKNALRVENSKLTMNGGDVISSAKRIGMLIQNSSVVSMKNTTVKNSGTFGIMARKNSKLTISNSKVTSTKNDSIVARDKTSLTAKGNTITSSGQRGIYVKNGGSIQISKNTIKKCSDKYSIVVDGGKGTISNNTLYKKGIRVTKGVKTSKNKVKK